MPNAKQWAGVAGLALALAAGCDDATTASDVNGPVPSTSSEWTAEDDRRVYDQVEFLGNPLVSEVTIAKAMHDAFNRTQPYNTGTFRPQTEQFITQVAGRPTAYASTIAGVLYPDMLVVDASKPASTAGWLSWALANGYGGRRLSDDVVDVGLIAIFSSLLSPEGASCAPGALPLCTDNVPANDRPFGATFPYLAAPSL